MVHKKLALVTLIMILNAGMFGFLAPSPEAGSAHRLGGTEVAQAVPNWMQVNSNGFGDPQAGEVTALEAFKGYLYAGIQSDLHDARIYHSADGTTWAPVIEPGFGISHDIAPRAILDFIIFHDRLYASTGRGGDPGQIYRSLDGLNWAPMVIYGFGDQDNVDISALAVYENMIYAGVTNSVTGAQIWRSFTGDNNTWTNVAPAAPGTAAASVTGFAEFDGALYAAVESEAPAQVWQSFGGALGAWAPVVNDGFGDSNTRSTGGMAVFGGHLYVGAGNSKTGAQLWRTGDGASWAQAISPGFGDPNNQKVETVFVFQNQLYVSVKNSVTGLEVWRSSNGTLWEQANQDGFGDVNNSSSNGSHAAAVFRSGLYLGTSNILDGGEVWRFKTSRAIVQSTGAYDGWVLESSETSNQGGSRNSTASTFCLGDNAQNKQYRTILSFNTQSLPDNAVITRVILRVKKRGIAGGGDPVNIFQGFLVDVRQGFFESSAGLQLNDFQAKADKSYGPFKPVLSNGWYAINLTPAEAYINKLAAGGGVTQVRLGFKLDDNNNALNNYLSLYSGEAVAASRPRLILEYYVR